MSSNRERFIWLCAVFTLVIANQSSPQVKLPVANILTCDGLKSQPQMKNFSTNKVFASDDHLDICVNNESTCCSQQMESHLHKLSIETLRTIRTAKTDLIKGIFTEGRTKFQNFFRELINESEKQLHKKFIGIYKSAYANNSHIPKAFYANLRKYLSDGKQNPKDILTGFFKEILKKIFVLLNDRNSADLECVGNTFDTLKPFGEVPRRLSSQLERSFIAARTFVYGMLSGKNVVDRLIGRPLSNDCLKSVTKMTHCSVCAGHTNVKPCRGYCESVFGNCFGSLMELERVWDEYLRQMQNLALQLEGDYNIEAVTESLPLDISHGIMAYQTASTTLSPKIKKLCPIGGRTKRSVTSSDTSDFFLDNNDGMKESPAMKPSKTPKRPTLASLTAPYRDHFRRFMKFWSKLSTTMCDETIVADNVTDKFCWNGFELVNNTESLLRGRNVSFFNDGENDMDIRIQIKELNTVITNLRAAISGDDIPNPDSIDDGSGSGSGAYSGSGSGDPTSTERPAITSDLTTPSTECVTCPTTDNRVLGVKGSAISIRTSFLVLTATTLLSVII